MTENWERITSPDQLNEYIRVTTPGAWVILSAVLLFFVGLSCWLFTGKLEVTIPVRAYKEGDHAVAFVPAGDAHRIEPGMPVRIWSGAERGSGTVTSVSKERVPFDDIVDVVGDAHAILMGIDEGHRFFQVSMDIPDGPQDVVQGAIIRQVVHPANFLLSVGP